MRKTGQTIFLKGNFIVSLFSSVATRATNTGKYKPSITMVVSTTNDCATPAGRVTVGTALWVCVTLGAEFAVGM